MENPNYSNKDKINGSLRYLAHRLNPMTEIRAGEAFFFGALRSSVVKSKDYFINQAYQKRMEKEKEQNANEHRDYYNHSKL
jgi:hypothetical protein